MSANRNNGKICKLHMMTTVSEITSQKIKLMSFQWANKYKFMKYTI